MKKNFFYEFSFILDFFFQIEKIFLVGGTVGDMSVPMAVGWVMSYWGTNTLLPSMMIMFFPAIFLFVLVMWVFPKMWERK
jgi:hypothetical protein